MAVPDWRDDRIGSALRGENPMVMARMRSGFAVIGDTQFLPGYSVLLPDDPAANHLSDLPMDRRRDFLVDMALLGEAIQSACRADGLRRVNYEILGNVLPILHAHVFPRYDWEPADKLAGEIGRYPTEEFFSPEAAYSDASHGDLRRRITVELKQLTDASYRP
jgi:diadenosine tetraphosphate (Ap4A) HIT family hydrolase